jgi:hypothetical protein
MRQGPVIDETLSGSAMSIPGKATDPDTDRYDKKSFEEFTAISPRGRIDRIACRQQPNISDWN